MLDGIKNYFELGLYIAPLRDPEGGGNKVIPVAGSRFLGRKGITVRSDVFLDIYTAEYGFEGPKKVIFPIPGISPGYSF